MPFDDLPAEVLDVQQDVAFTSSLGVGIQSSPHTSGLNCHHADRVCHGVACSRAGTFGADRRSCSSFTLGGAFAVTGSKSSWAACRETECAFQLLHARTD